MNGALRKATSRFAIATAAGLALSASSAWAADLGGNCCADLEERVAELEATTARKGNRKVSLVISGQVNRAMLYWDDGRMKDLYGVDNSNTRSAFQFDGSARINPSLTAGFNMVFAISTGARNHQVSQLDDDGNSNPSNATGIPRSPQFADADVYPAVELANWYLDHKQFGRITVGRINSAQANSTTVDLGGIGVISNANMGLWDQAFILRSSNAVYTAGGPNGRGGFVSGTTGYGTWGALRGGSIIDISGLSRQDGISYQTPEFMGFFGTIAYAEDNFWDAALRYAGEFQGFRIAAAVSYSQNRDTEMDPFIATIPLAPTAVGATVLTPQSFSLPGPDQRKWQGSASILHVPTGLFVTGAYINLSFHGLGADVLNGTCLSGGAAGTTPCLNRPDTNAYYIAGGISQNWLGIGKTVLYVDGGVVADAITGTTAASAFGQVGSIVKSEVRYWGLGVVQNIDAAAMELYAGYRNESASVITGTGAALAGGGTNLAPDDLKLFMTGARIKF